MDNLSRVARGPFFLIALVALIVACLSATRDYAVPVAVAVLIWFLINAIADGLATLPGLDGRMPRRLAKALSIVLMATATLAVGQVVADNMVALGQTVSFEGGFAESPFVKQVKALAARFSLEDIVQPARLLDWVGFDALIGWALAAARTLISDVSLVFLYVLFLLVDEQFYEAKLRALVPDVQRRAQVEAALRRVTLETRLYLRLMSLVSAGVAMATYLICRTADLEGAGFWGFLAFLLNFIPTIGSITAVALPGVFAILTLPDTAMVVGMILALSIVQFVAGEIVVPRVMGDNLNLSAFVILFSLVVWGAMWGPAGMFLAIPMTVILMLIFSRFESTRPIALLLSRDGRLPSD